MDENQAELAAAVGSAMYAADKASQSLGIKLVKIEPGFAVMQMSIREDMLNGHGIAHGGFMFALADSTFAFACNSRNRKTLALTCTIHFTSPGQLGDTLTATAREVALKGRTGIYDVAVVNQNGDTIAQFRGTSYGTSGTAIN